MGAMAGLTFGRRLLAELPFVLNVPEGEYSVAVGGDVVTLHIGHERGALGLGGSKQSIVRVCDVGVEDLPRLTLLRTLVEHREQRTVDVGEVVPATEEQLVQAIARQLITSYATTLGGPTLVAEAAANLDALGPTERAVLATRTARQHHAGKLFRVASHESFLAAINALVRHYMVELQDHFAEEVVLHHLACTWSGGVLQVLDCEGDFLDSVHYSGKIPPVMRRPWLIHPPDRIERLKASLASGAAPDPIDLLAVRAQSLLERGATRSAVIEASAALESAVARRLRAGLLARGLTEHEAATKLQNTQRRFSDRCKSLMMEVVGKSLAAVDASLWQRVVNHRDNYRHKVTHDDTEPPPQAAQEAVKDFVALARIARDL